MSFLLSFSLFNIKKKNGFIILHDEFDESESMPSAGGSIVSKNSSPIVREALPFRASSRGTIIIAPCSSNVRIIAQTRRVIYESSVSATAPCASRHRRGFATPTLSNSALTFAINNVVAFLCARDHDQLSVSRLAAERVSFLFLPVSCAFMFLASVEYI